MKDAIDFLEKERLNEEHSALICEADDRYTDSLMHWTNENALCYAIQILKDGNKAGS